MHKGEGGYSVFSFIILYNLQLEMIAIYSKIKRHFGLSIGMMMGKVHAIQIERYGWNKRKMKAQKTSLHKDFPMIC